MFQKLKLFIVLMCFGVLAVAGCNDSSSKTKPTADPTTKGYPNGGLLAEAANLSDDGIVILDTRSADAYNAGHIPGALSMPWQGFVDSSTNLKPVSELETQLGAAGIKRNTWMIIYDDTTASWGAAGRLFWMFEYLGCENARILDGGWDKWIADGNNPETTAQTRKAAKFTAIVKDSVVVDKEHIHDRMNDADFALVDTRTDEEYNGWTLYNEKRGGRITGAVQIPYEWAFQTDKTILEYADMKELFESRGITPDKEIVPYCTAGIRSAYAYFLCRLMGYERVSNYDASMWDWAAANAATYPMEKMENYQALVYPGWVDALIAGGNPGTAGTPSTYSGKRYVVVHVSTLYWKGAANPEGYDPNTDYDSGHIPGAINIPLNAFDVQADGGIYPWTCPDDGNLLPPAQLKAVIEGYGITHETMVILYCGNKSYIGGAYRIAWALLYAGVEDVRYLNGDLAAWEENGGVLETTRNLPIPVGDFGIAVPAHPEYYATTGQVEAMISDPNAVIADDRSWTEYAVNNNSACIYDFFCVPGHIPGAVWVHDMYWYLDDFYSWHEPGYYKPATLRSFSEVKQEWVDLGLTPDKKIAFHCGGGWRSSLVWFFGYLMGYPDISNYDGGWYEWTWDSSRPVTTGESQ